MLGVRSKHQSCKCIDNQYAVHIIREEEQFDGLASS